MTADRPPVYLSRVDSRGNIRPVRFTHGRMNYKDTEP
jgi:hypothetical protein